MRPLVTATVMAVIVATAACTASGAASPPPGAAASDSTPPASPTRLVRVAAASDLRFAMDELATQFEAAHSGVSVEPTYGSSGNFAAQIANGAPFDIFFSADAAYPREIERAGLADAGSTHLYAIGQIVVWVLASSRLDVASRGLLALSDGSVRKVSIANPEHAPYGQAAVAAMRSAGVYDAVEPKLVLGENVSQAAQFVESGNADVGVIALSLALAPALRDKGSYAVVPIESYPRLEQGAVVLRSATDADAARAFLDFVLGPDGRTVLGRSGFLLPEP